jgi:hypothetical protein
MKILSTIVIGCFITFFSVQDFSQNKWEIDNNKDGIKVYTRVEKGSDFKTFKAIIEVDNTIDEIIKILKNVSEYTNWYGYTKTSKLLKAEKEAQYNYVETIFPWPYSNRDMVYKMSIEKDSSGAVKVLLKGLPNYIPKKKGIVRMKKAEGYILLQPNNKKTQITYVFHSEPGKNIPAWLANNSIANLPFKTFSGLRKTLKEKK